MDNTELKIHKIYKLIYNNEIIYIGRTMKSLVERKKGGYKYISFHKECHIELIEETDDVSRERYWIEYYISIGCKLLNRRNGDGFDKKQYLEENKEYISLQRKDYYDNNIETFRDYYSENKENISSKKRKYYLENREKRLKYQNEYHKNKNMKND